LVVFVTRYLDLFFGWKTLYVFVMKIIFISLTAYTIYLMKFKKPYNLSLDRESDAFPHYYMYGAALLAAIIAHKSLNPIDFLWSFSIWLESLAILPQLFMITKLKDIENINAHYVLFMGLYRGFYIFHW
jgi:ER lumen protein retaining receptor